MDDKNFFLPAAILFSFLAISLMIFIGCQQAGVKSAPDKQMNSPVQIDNNDHNSDTSHPSSELDADKILNDLKRANIAFNSPDTINLNKTAIVQLLLSMRKSIETLEQELTHGRNHEGAEIKISDRMQAKLSGPDFEIVSITPETQAISANENTEWKWEVKPKTRGYHYLHLTLSALVKVEGETTLRTIRTFDKTIRVEVTFGQQVSSFVKNNWQWLWAAVLVPFAGWFWKKRKAKRP